jgi:hypothetical protein
LNPPRATAVEAVGGPLVVGRRDRLVGKRLQVVAETREDGPIADAAQQFLPDTADEGGASVCDEAAQFVEACPNGHLPTISPGVAP